MTLFTKSYQKIYISSEPQGAIIKINERKVGSTPMEVPVKKVYEWPKISLEKEGYFTKTWYVPSTLNPWSVLLNNISFFNWIIDGITGKFLHYKQKKYHIILPKDTTYAPYNKN